MGYGSIGVHHFAEIMFCVFVLLSKESMKKNMYDISND